MKNQQIFTTSNPSHSILHIQFNSPQTLNALTSDHFDQLKTLFKPPPEIKCIILTSIGKHFTSGLQLNPELFQQKDDPSRTALQLGDLIQSWQNSITSIKKCKVPVIVGVQGGCVGGGVDIITACCIRYAIKNSFYTIKEIDIGLVADIGTFPRIQNIVREGVLREWAYTGRRVESDEALREGLISKVFENKSEMMKGMLDLAQKISEKSQIVTQGLKFVMNKKEQQNEQNILEFIKIWNMSMLQSSDVSEAVKATLTKTKPVFAKL